VISFFLLGETLLGLGFPERRSMTDFIDSNLSIESFFATESQRCCGENCGSSLHWRLFSGSPDHTIVVDDVASLSLQFDGVNLDAQIPYIVRNSAVSTILTVGTTNVIRGSIGGVLCLEWSNITFDGGSGGELTVLASGPGSAIGTNESCGTLPFIGGRITVVSSVGAGIRTWNLVHSAASIQSILFGNSEVDATAGACVGSGSVG
jgi:hypothetical protein